VNRFCFLNRLAVWLGLTRFVQGHYFDCNENPYKCRRCGLDRRNYQSFRE